MIKRGIVVGGVSGEFLDGNEGGCIGQSGKEVGIVVVGWGDGCGMRKWKGCGGEDEASGNEEKAHVGVEYVGKGKKGG